MAIDYTKALGLAGAASPAQAVNQGIIQGFNIAQMKQQFDAQELQQQQLQKKLALQEQLKTDVAALYDNPNATAQDYQKVYSKYAPLQALQGRMQKLEESARQGIYKDSVNFIAAVDGGNIDIAKGILERRLEAAENSGNQEAIDTNRILLSQFNADPKAARETAVLTMFSADPDNFVENYNKFTAPTTTDKFRELDERARAAGYEPGSPEYKKFMVEGQRKAPLVSVSGAEKEGGKILAKSYGKLLEQGQKAERSSLKINRLDQLLQEGVETGFEARIKSYLGGLGIKTEGLNEIQAFEAAVKDLVPEQREPGSGATSDFDARTFIQALPQLINQPGGNRLIIQGIKAVNEYDSQVGQIAERQLSGDLTASEARQAINQLNSDAVDKFRDDLARFNQTGRAMSFSEMSQQELQGVDPKQLSDAEFQEYVEALEAL